MVYPESLPAREWLRAYSAWFETVELNSTFYRLPKPSTVEQWRELAPAGFVFAVKVGRFGTHNKKLREASGWLARHLDVATRLGGALGPQLVQLPPNWKRDVCRLDDFLGTARSSLRWAVELREPSWIHDDVFDVLARHDAALCIHDLLSDHPWERTAAWTYVRFHGPDREHPYHGRYGGRRLWRWADRLAGWLEEGCDVYAYFNNDVEGNAVADAAWLRDRLA